METGLAQKTLNEFREVIHDIFFLWGRGKLAVTNYALKSWIKVEYNPFSERVRIRIKSLRKAKRKTKRLTLEKCYFVDDMIAFSLEEDIETLCQKIAILNINKNCFRETNIVASKLDFFLLKELMVNILILRALLLKECQVVVSCREIPQGFVKQGCCYFWGKALRKKCFWGKDNSLFSLAYYFSSPFCLEEREIKRMRIHFPCNRLHSITKREMKKYFSKKIQKAAAQ